MLTGDWGAFCKLLQAFMLGVSKFDNIFSLLSKELISLENKLKLNWNILLPYAPFLWLNYTVHSHTFYSDQKTGLNTW